MNETKRNWGRVALYASVAGSMVLSLVPFGAGTAAAQGASRKIGDFDVAGRFLEVWQAQGNDQASTYVNGLAITARRAEISTEDGKSYESQWFERAKYEAHPENKAPYDVLLGRLGANFVSGRGSVDPATNKPRNPSDAPFVKIAQPGDLSATKLFFPESGHSVSGKILEYWNRYGGLAQFGYPLSEAFNEASTDGKTYSTQYFERARFEVHPEKAAPYEVELGLLGVQQYKTTPIAADKLPMSPIAGATTTKNSLVMGSSQQPDDLTVFNNALITTRVRRFLEMSLVDRDDSGNVYPQIAWYVPTLENGGSYYVGSGDDRHLVAKYKLRQGVKWADGKEVTSNDAVFYFKLIMDPDSPVTSRAEYQKLENVDNPDKYTVIYNWRSLNQLKTYYNSIPDKENYGFLRVYIDQKKPAGSLVYSEIGGIYPQHVLQNINPAQIPSTPFASNPLGAGPWKVQSWNRDQDMTLVLNDNYNLTAKPLITKITIKFITDVNQLLAQAKTGELDLISSEAFSAPPADAAGLQAAGFKITSRPATTWEHIDFFMDFGPFKDANVRMAITRAINRQRLSDVVYAGTAGVQETVVPPSAWHSLTNPNFAKEFPALATKYKLPDLGYDANAAKAMLDAAGWKDTNGNGTRDKGGVELSFEYGTTTQAARQQVQALVSADLKAVGVDAKTKDYPAGVFFAQDSTSPRNTGVSQFAQFAWVGTVETDFEAWTCSSIWNAETQAGNNSQRYCNQDLDTLNGEYNAGASRAEIAEASAKAQLLLATEAVVVPLVTRANIEVARASLQNHIETNSSVTSNWNALQWFFK